MSPYRKKPSPALPLFTIGGALLVLITGLLMYADVPARLLFWAAH